MFEKVTKCTIISLTIIYIVAPYLARSLNWLRVEDNYYYYY
jgi:hypothetical protein